jgi:hypothetical protein
MNKKKTLVGVSDIQNLDKRRGILGTLNEFNLKLCANIREYPKNAEKQVVETS